MEGSVLRKRRKVPGEQEMCLGFVKTTKAPSEGRIEKEDGYFGSDMTLREENV